MPLNCIVGTGSHRKEAVLQTAVLKAHERDKWRRVPKHQERKAHRGDYHTKASALRLRGVPPAPFPLTVHAFREFCSNEVRWVQGFC